jgi:hypothetical protein
MNRFCINRHQQGINSVFLDFSARKVWLKDLWHVKWAKNFDISAPCPNWETEAPWMNLKKRPGIEKICLPA